MSDVTITENRTLVDVTITEGESDPIAVSIIYAAGGGGGGSTPVIDNLASTSATSALSANQGRVLDEGKAATASPTFTGVVSAPYFDASVAMEVQDYLRSLGYITAATYVDAGTYVKAPTIIEELETLATGSGAITVSNNGRIEKEIDGTTTFTLPSTANVSSFSLVVEQGAGGSHETLFTAGADTIEWANGTPDTTAAPAGQKDIYMFVAVTGGWLANYSTFAP
jgi:hypothetical protein